MHIYMGQLISGIQDVAIIGRFLIHWLPIEGFVIERFHCTTKQHDYYIDTPTL